MRLNLSHTHPSTWFPIYYGAKKQDYQKKKKVKKNLIIMSLSNSARKIPVFSSTSLSSLVPISTEEWSQKKNVTNKPEKGVNTKDGKQVSSPGYTLHVQ